MSKNSLTDLIEILSPVVDSLSLVVEDVKFHQAGAHSRLVVVVDLADGPGGVDEATLTAATRAISAKLDEVDPIKSAYTLEVSSAGAERELTDARLFRRAVGRVVKVTDRQGNTCEFTLEQVNPTRIQGTLAGGDVVEFGLDDVVSARTVLKW